MTLELTLTKTIPAPRKQVFEAWLSPEALAKFMTPGPGMTVPEANVDAKEGGAFLIVMQAGEKKMPHTGVYKSIKQFEELSFTWESEHSTVDSLVTLTFKETGPKETELTLHQRGFANEEMRNNHQGGWGAINEALTAALAA